MLPVSDPKGRPSGEREPVAGEGGADTHQVPLCARHWDRWEGLCRA